MHEVTCVLIEDYKEYLRQAKIVDLDQPDNIRRSISSIISYLNNNGVTGTYGDYIWLPDHPDHSDQTGRTKMDISHTPDGSDLSLREIRHPDWMSEQEEV